MEQVRTLPLRVALAEGESLHSWLLRLAHRNGIPLLRLAPVLGFGDRLRVPHNYALSWRLPEDLLRRIETQAGLAPRALDAAVLDQFDPLGWRPVAGSRYCTGCLTETAGIWPMRWQLPYTFACLRHRCLLAAVCPCCHRAPHSAGMTLRAGLLPPTHCVLGARRETRPCDAHLLSHPREALRANDARLAAQKWVNQRLDHLIPSTVTDLRDLDALAIWFRQRIEPAELTHLGKATVTAITEYRDHNHGLKREQPTASVVAAAMTVQAIRLITADDKLRYRRFAPLLRDVYTQYRAGKTPSKRGPMILSHKRLTSLSKPLQHKLLLSADGHLPVSERLRYYTCTPTPHPPQPGSTIAAERARHIPQYLWHDWLIRFLPRQGAHVDAIATDLPVALLLPGNPVRNRHATDELNRWRHNVSLALGRLSQRHPDILRAVCTLAEYLDTAGSPIDYRRRRATFTDIDLPQTAWDRYCDAANAHPGKGGRRLNARRYLFQLLTGADLSNRQHLLAFRSGEEQGRYLGQFQRGMETALRHALHQHAADLLAAAGIDEPVIWSPPAQCAAGLILPGREPTDIDTGLLYQLITVQKCSFTSAAEQLDVSVEHVRYATWQLPRETIKHPKNTPPAARRARERAIDVLDRAFFEREHLQGRKSLRMIAAETGFSTKLISRHAQQAGVPFNPSIKRLADIDTGWLHQQAGKLQRANDDIAAELGVRGETIRRYRANHGIRGRSTGSAGHVVTNLTHPSLPHDIRRAVEGQRNGWQRLQRLQQMLDYPSMNSAAQALGLHTQNLNLQIQRLETDIGAQLLHRAPHRYAPMVPTARGQRLLNQLAQPAIRELIRRYATANTYPKPAPRKSRNAFDTTDTIAECA